MRAILVLFALVSSLTLGAFGEPAEWPNGEYNPYDRLPIRVFIDESNLTAKTRSYLDDVDSAMAYWERGGNGALNWEPRFEQTEFRANVDLVLWFVEADHVGCGENVTGAGCGGFGNPESQGMVKLATLIGRGPPGYSVSPQHISHEMMTVVAKHEFGHALGLPHSDDPADVMHASGDHLNLFGDSPDTIWAVRNIKWVALGFVGMTATYLSFQAASHGLKNWWARWRLR